MALFLNTRNLVLVAFVFLAPCLFAEEDGEDNEFFDKRVYITLGSENFSQSGRLNGGNYGYAMIGIEPIVNTIIFAKYSTSLFPMAGQDRVLGLSVKQYYYRLQSSLHFSSSLAYINNVATGFNNLGSVGAEFTFMDSGHSQQVSLAFLPFSVYYSLDSKDFVFQYEYFRIYFKF